MTVDGSNPQIDISITDQEAGLVPILDAAFQAALGGAGLADQHLRHIDGFCGQKQRALLNILVGMTTDARYLEVGVFRGATLCAAIADNRVVAMGVDNWSEYGGKASEFYTNLAAAKHERCKVSILEQDFRTVRFSHIGKFNIYFYDGPHRLADQYDGVTLALPALDEIAVLLVDDWNWDHVREGTTTALRDAGADILSKIEIRTSLDNQIPAVAFGPSDWHNGLFAAVIRNPLAHAAS